METTVSYLTFDEVGITIAVIAVALAFIVLTWNAVRAIHDWRQLAKKPTNEKIADHEQRIANLESCCKDVKGKLVNDFKFQQDNMTMNQLMLKSIKSLLQHAVDGNDTDMLMKREQEIDEYLLSHTR